MKKITNLKKEEVVNFYNNKKDWTVKEIEAFENKIAEIYKEDSDFIEEIAGFNDDGYGKYNIESFYPSDWGYEYTYKGKHYGTYEIIELTKDYLGSNPFIFECKDFTIVDYEGLMKEFKNIVKKG